MIADGDCTKIPKRIQLPKPFKLWWLRHGILGFRNLFCVSLEGIPSSNKLYLHWLFFIIFFFLSLFVLLFLILAKSDFLIANTSFFFGGGYDWKIGFIIWSIDDHCDVEMGIYSLSDEKYQKIWFLVIFVCLYSLISHKEHAIPLKPTLVWFLCLYLL